MIRVLVCAECNTSDPQRIRNTGPQVGFHIRGAVRPTLLVVGLTLTRVIKSVVTGQAPVTLELRNTPGKKHKLKVVHAYITADAIHASTRKI